MIELDHFQWSVGACETHRWQCIAVIDGERVLRCFDCGARAHDGGIDD